jgi:hypothetical protein
MAQSDMVYRFRPGSRIKGDPQVIGERLSTIRRGNGGDITPEMVLKDARSAHSPLHPLFEWDDRVAGHKWRIFQASHVIQCVATVVEDAQGDERLTRAYVSVKRRGHDRNSFVPVTTAMEDPGLRAQVLERAFGELQIWRDKYQHYEELFGIFDAIAEEASYVVGK